MPGPWGAKKAIAPNRVLELNRGCVNCHREIATEWQASLHATAYTHAEFQRALQVEPLPVCKGCHAPDTNPEARDNPAVQRLGVSCVTCHVVAGDIVAVPGTSPAKTHPVLRRASFATVQACANCHQFAFPGESSRSPLNLMQSTVNEFLVQGGSEMGCSGCHMPQMEAGHRSHRFDVTRNSAFLQAALRVAAVRKDNHHVELRLTPRHVGHAFPTGDLFRRLTVEVEALGPEYSRVEAHAQCLTREFETTITAGGVKHRRPVSDTRIPASGIMPPMVFEWVNDISQYPVLYRVLYQRVQHPGMVGQPDAEVAGEVELASGELRVSGDQNH